MVPLAGSIGNGGRWGHHVPHAARARGAARRAQPPGTVASIVDPIRAGPPRDPQVPSGVRAPSARVGDTGRRRGAPAVGPAGRGGRQRRSTGWVRRPGAGGARRPASPRPGAEPGDPGGGRSQRELPSEDIARGTHVGRDAMDWGARPCLSPSGVTPHVARRTVGLAIPCLMHARDPGVTPYLARSPPPSRTHRPPRRGGVGRTNGPEAPEPTARRPTVPGDPGQASWALEAPGRTAAVGTKG